MGHSQAANASIAEGIFALAVGYRKKIITTSARGAAVNENIQTLQLIKNGLQSNKNKMTEGFVRVTNVSSSPYILVNNAI